MAAGSGGFDANRVERSERMSKRLAEQLQEILGAEHVVPGDEVPPSPWETHQPFRGRFMLMPASTDQIAATLRLCSRAGQPVVPIGGLTNLVQGCATESGDAGLSLARMNAIEEIDPVAQTMTVQAGVTLREAQEAADAAGLDWGGGRRPK